MDTPSGQLASKILDRLIQEKLLTPDDRAKLLSKLAEGKLKSEDWRLPIELAAGKGKLVRLRSTSLVSSTSVVRWFHLLSRSRRTKS